MEQQVLSLRLLEALWMCNNSCRSIILQMIMQEQDKAIDSITGTVATLTEQAGLMGQEISEHIECVPKKPTH